MKRLFQAAATALTLFAPAAVQAQARLLPPCTATGNCSITDMLAVFGNAVEFLLGIVGAVALGYFIWAGFKLIYGMGRPDAIKSALAMMKNAVIGIVIIFSAGLIVRFTLRALTGGNSSVPAVGESCDPATKRSVPNGAGLWVLMPGGATPDKKIILEGLVCIRKESGLTPGAGCANLNGALQERGRQETYRCIEATQGTGCVRGLCNLGADYACCL